MTASIDRAGGGFAESKGLPAFAATLFERAQKMTFMQFCRLLEACAPERPGFGTRVGSFFRNLPSFYREVAAEMRKVTWPDRAQLIDATWKIIVLVLMLGAIIALMDLGLQFFLVKLPQLLTGR